MRISAAIWAGALCAGVWAQPSAPAETPVVRIVHLTSGASGFDDLRDRFNARNPGYDLTWQPEVSALGASESARVVFVQRGETAARVGDAASDIGVGDIILLRPGETLSADARVDLLVFTTPEPLPDDLPRFVRPDWDPNITDTPGGCATESGAYRRICLTWLKEKGEYNYHALNAHRVRITDSFSHYHPPEGGFDEFYLVQMAQPGAGIIVSDQTDRIVDPGAVTAAEAGSLLHRYDLRVGDLVYLPRGVMHRGLGGVLAQVITAPGFVPGAEIGIDHCLRAINERLGLEGADALPYNQEASAGPVVR